MKFRAFSGFIIVLLLISLTKLNAQAPYTCFTLDKNIGCVPLTVTATNCGIKTGYTQYQFNYSGGDKFEDDSVHTYTEPGTYTIMQYNHDGTQPYNTSHTVTVLPLPKPSFIVYKFENAGIRVEINDTNYDSFVIDFGDGTVSAAVGQGANVTHTYGNTASKTITVTGVYTAPDPDCGNDSSITIHPLPIINPISINYINVTSVSSTSGELQLNFTPQAFVSYKVLQKTFSGSYAIINTVMFDNNTSKDIVVTNLNTENESYCYQLLPFDDAQDFPSDISNELCSETIIGEAQNNQNKITWKNLPGATSYSLNIGSNPPISGLSINEYTDNNVKCGQEYEYKVTAHFPGGLYSTSGAIKVKGISTSKPAAIEEINSTIEEDKVKVTWEKPLNFPVQYYIISNSENNSPYSTTLNYPGESPFIDLNSNPNNNSYCYKIKYSDSCSNFSDDSLTTCPVFLEVTKNESSVDLAWTGYSGSWDSGIGNYEIEVLDRSNAVVETINSALLTSHTYNVNFGTASLRFRIKVNSGSANETSYSNIVEVTFEPEIYIPTVFTPNGDGTNDIFSIKGKYFKDFRLTIFNRWGEVIFYTDKLDTGWDGIVEGVPAPVDSYAYVIEVKDNADKSIIRNGTVTLLR